MNVDGVARARTAALHSARAGVARISLAVAAAALFAAILAPAQALASAAIWTARCDTCHGTPPALPQLNAAGARAILDRAIAVNAGLSMGVFASTTAGDAANGADPLTAADRNSLVAYIATVAGHDTQTVSAAYTGATTITLQDISTTSQLSDVVTGLATVTAPTRGTLGAYSVAGPSVNYTHTATNCTQDSFVYRGTTGTAANTTGRTVTVNITPPAAPTASNSSPTIAYSTGATGVTLNIGGGPALGLILTTGLNPAVGTLNFAGTTATYASNSTVYAPTLTFSYRVDGPCADSAIANVTLSVNPPPAPVVTNVGTAGSPTVVAAGIPIDFNLAPNISGVVASNPAATYALVASQPTAAGSGTTSVAGNVVTFTPGAGFTGPTTFTYTKAGPGGTSNTGTVFIEVAAAPVVSPTSVTTAFNTAVAVNLAAFIASSQPVTAVTPSSPVNGTAAATGTTTITFTPTAGFFGTGSFAYTATSAGGTSATPATVTVTVNPPPPTVSPTSVTIPFNSGTPVASATIDLAPLIGPAGATVLSVSPSGATNGTVVATGPTTVSFTPTAGYVGPASFSYTATNAGGTSGSALVSLTVAPPPPPVVGPLSVLVSATMPTLIDLAPAITGIYTTVSIASQPAAGSVSLSGAMATYTPLPGHAGTTTFTYVATGLGGTSAPATVTLTYTAAPVTADRNLVVPFDTSATIDLTSAFAGVITDYAITRPPAHGTLAVNGPYVTYTPTPGYFGADSFQYTATGPGGASVPGTVSVTVNPPIAVVTGLQVDVPFATPTVIDLTRAITGAATGFIVTRAPFNGTLVVTGTLATYTPAAGYAGGDSFEIIAVNATGNSDPGIVTILVGSQAPAAASASLTVALNESGTIDLAPFITGSLISGVAISSLPEHGLADVNGTKVTYTPRTNFFGGDRFTYVAYGDAGSSQSVVVTVTVVGRPDPSQDKNVVGLVEAQAQTARRFSRAQIGNFQRRLESLHAGPPAGDPASAPPAAPGPAAMAPDVAPARRPRAPAPDPFAAPASASGFVPVSFPAAEAPPKSASGFLERALAGTLVSAATSKSVDMSTVTGGSASTGMQGGTSIWLGGLAHFGKYGATEGSSQLAFSTDGLSLGVDRRFSDRLVLGLGIGYGRDDTDIGTDGSRSKTTGNSFAVYGSYQPSRSTFVDAVVGAGSLDIDTNRYVESMDEFATGTRDGQQFFASVAAGYEFRKEGILISPYGRLDFATDKLKAMTETGAGLNALTFEEQTLRSTQGALGLRLETRQQTDYGWAVPRARIEYRHEFQDAGRASIRYADQFGGTVYSVTPAGSSRNSLLFGVGADFLWKRGLKLGIDYQGERNSDPGTVQAIRFLLSQDLDGRLPDVPWSWAWKPFAEPIGIEGGFSYDDNVSRGRIAGEKFSDQVYNFGLNGSLTFPYDDNTRAIATGMLTVDKFHDYTGLGRTSGGLQGELQYRASGDFDSITYALFARGWIDGYESKLRSGLRATAGANARRSLTDRIDLFGEIGSNWRRAESAVFEGRDYYAKLNIDYSLGAAGIVYLAGEFRRGDTFASGLASLENLNLAEVFVRDDAFDRGDIFAYRFEGRTLLGTIGYNRPLGPRDSIDFSYRRVQTTPFTRPETGPSTYNVNQYSILYLMRF